MDYKTCKIYVLRYLISALLFFSKAISADTTPPASLLLSTNAFQNNMAMPTLYTCDGKNSSPELSWKQTPAGTKTYTLVVNDLDVPDQAFYHWVVYNIPSNIHELTQGAAIPTGSSIGNNSFNKQDYSGPCPPKGTTHRYIFTLYALDTRLDLPTGSNGGTVIAAAKGHILSQVDLTGIYSRWIE